MTGVRDKTALAKDLIDTVARVLGSQPGCRVTHEDGIILTGTFTATPRARELTRAAHMQGDPVRVTVRFSNGFPDPHLPDAAEDNPRGMAVKFYCPTARRRTWCVSPGPSSPPGRQRASSG
jgi:catalase